MSHKPDIVIIGAGIIGMSCALQLQSLGKNVMVIDRTGVAAEASSGNAGAFAFSDIEPLATPGILKKAPFWLLDPLGPLSIRPTYAPHLLPWLLKFWRASWQDRYQCALSAQASLMAFSREALERQVKLAKSEQYLQREGQLNLYETDQEWHASQKSLDVKQAHGVELTRITSHQEIADIQPGISPRFKYAAYTPKWINTRDPLTWTHHLADQFTKAGGTIEKDNVSDIDLSGDQIRLTAMSGTISAPKLILAAGAWSHHLTRTIGDNIPLETERGYNTTLPKGAFDLRTHLTFGSHGFVVSKINQGVRVGGAVELGGLKLAPNYNRSKTLLHKAKQFLPDLNIKEGKEWMGFRPSMPDSLPVIGPSSKSPQLFYAFGHGHLGLTQSAGTAELIASMITGNKPEIDMAPFSPARFSHRTTHQGIAL